MNTCTLSRSIAVILFLFLAGCASTPFKDDVETLSPEQATVFGNIEVIKDGKRHKLNVLGGIGFALYVHRANDPEGSALGVRDPGAFFWGLPPGDYMIVRFLGDGFGMGLLRVQFTVTPGTKALYIGDLRLVADGNYYGLDIRDNFAAGIEAFRTKYPGTQIVPERAIARIDSPGTSAKVTSICGTDWGIECTRSNAGVKPIYPDSPRHTTVDSLAPILKWTPSAQPGATYDVVVYEEARFRRNPISPIIDSFPGRQIQYVQGLTQPQFKLSAPLKPDRTYHWSVRLRRGETVSTWSTFGFFDFFIVGYAFGHGQLFNFSTPAK